MIQSWMALFSYIFSHNNTTDFNKLSFIKHWDWIWNWSPPTASCAGINHHVVLDLQCPYPEPVVFQWLSSGNPVCLELRPQCTLECHWRNASVLPVVFQWSSSGFPVVFQCVPIMQINTGSPLEHHWALASASVVPVAFQCTCGSSGLPVCSNYAN